MTVLGICLCHFVSVNVSTGGPYRCHSPPTAVIATMNASSSIAFALFDWRHQQAACQPVLHSITGRHCDVTTACQTKPVAGI